MPNNSTRGGLNNSTRGGLNNSTRGGLNNSTRGGLNRPLLHVQHFLLCLTNTYKCMAVI